MKTFSQYHFISDGLRFLVAGGINTLLTIGIYQLLLFYFSHGISYSLSWTAGLLFIYFVYPSKVFPGGINTLKRRVYAIASYLIVFASSLWFLDLLVSNGVHSRIAIFGVLIISILLNFFSMRVIFRFFNGNNQNNHQAGRQIQADD